MKTLLPAKLAYRDLLHDRKVSLCVIASLAAVIAPLLLLFSLKFGIISHMQDELAHNPRNLEIRLNGNGHLDAAWFRWLNAQPEVQFAIPLTRSLNTTAVLKTDSSHFVPEAELIPTKAGDPLLKNQPVPDDSSLLLSSKAAEALNAAAGGRVELILTRRKDGQNQRAIAALRVAAVLPESAYPRPAAFITLPVLEAAEDYRDGAATAIFHNDGDAPRPRTGYAKARIYAKSLDDVAPLAKKLREEKHIDTDTQAAAIAEVKAINRTLSKILLFIAAAAVLAGFLALLGAFFSNVERKRKDTALLRLLGFPAAAVYAYSVIQALLLSSAAVLASFAIYFLFHLLINGSLSASLASGVLASRVLPVHLLLCWVLASGGAALAALIGGRRALHIQPAESLRDV